MTPARRAALEEIRDAGPDGLGFGTIPRALRRQFESAGLIERVPDERTVHVVRHRLTDAGRRALEDE